MGAYQYDHYRGNKLSQRELENRKAEGWTMFSHSCSADHVHTYIFKRKKEAGDQ